MNDGNQFVLEPEANNADTLPNDLHEYAKWLLADPRTLEVWGLIGARLARVECVTNENQSLELDSGDWFVVRVSGLENRPEKRIRRLAYVLVLGGATMNVGKSGKIML